MRHVQRLSLLAILLCCASARAQTLADHVPGDAIAYLGWKGADSPDTGYAGSHLQAIIDASGFAQLRDQVLPQVMQKITAPSNDHGESALAAKTTLEILWRHPSAIFFAGITKNPDNTTAPKVGLICQAAADSDALMTLFNTASHGPSAPPMARAFTAGDCTVFLIGYDSNDAILADQSKSLKADQAFTRMTAETGKDPLLCGFADVSRLFDQIDQAIAGGADENTKEAWPKARDASGLMGIKHLSFGAGFEGKDWQSRSFIDAPAPRTGLLNAMEPTPIDPALLARVPVTAKTAMLGQFNFGEFLTQSRAVLGAANPAAGNMYDKAMGVVQMMIGRNLQRDILAPLGSQWAMYTDASLPLVPVSTPGAEEMPVLSDSFVLVNKLVDPAKALQGWTMLSYAINNASAGFIRARHLPVSMSTTQNVDQTVFTIATPYGQPSWTIKDGFMYFGLSPDGVIAAANRASGDLITHQPAFVELSKQLDPSGHFTAFEYHNFPASAQHTYAASQAGINKLRDLAQKHSISLPKDILPPYDTVLAQLSPALEISWADDSGWHSRLRSPIPGTSSQSQIGFSGGLIAGILLPSLNRARETANRVKCASNERQMGMAILLFANDHQGKYPANFSDMMSESLSPQVFLCPASSSSLPANFKTMSPADQAAWINDHADYVYVGAGLNNNTAGATDVIVYEKPEDHHEGMNILFGDGHVEFDRMPQAVKMIQDQHKTVPNVPLPDSP